MRARLLHELMHTDASPSRGRMDVCVCVCAPIQEKGRARMFSSRASRRWHLHACPTAAATASFRTRSRSFTGADSRGTVASHRELLRELIVNREIVGEPRRIRGQQRRGRLPRYSRETRGRSRERRVDGTVKLTTIVERRYRRSIERGVDATDARWDL